MKTKMIIQISMFSILIAQLALPLTANAAESDYEMPGAVAAVDLADDIFTDSLARLPQVRRESLDASGQEAFDTYVSPGTGYETGLRGPIGKWMHSPELAKAMFDVRQRVRYGSDRDQRLTELTIISVAREINNQYEYTAHEPLAKAAGLEQEIIDAVRFRKPIEESRNIAGFGETEEVIVRFAREVISEEKVSSETFARAIDIFGEEGVMDLTGLIGYYSFVAITLKAFDVQRPVGSDLLLPLRK
mgnify:FL=1